MRGRLLPGRAKAARSAPVRRPACASPLESRNGRAGERVDRLGDEALAPGPRAAVDLRLPVDAGRRGPRRPAGRRCRRSAGFGTARRRAGALPSAEPSVGRGVPVAPRTASRTVSTVALDPREERVAVARRSRSPDSRTSRERAGAVVAQQEQPGVDGAGDGGGQRAGAGHQVEAQRRGSARWSRRPAPAPARTARAASGPAAVAKMAGTSPPGPLRCGSTTCRTKPAATAASKALPPELELAHGRLRGEPVRRGDHAEGALRASAGW